MLDTSTLSKDGGQDTSRLSKSYTDDLLISYKILIIGDAGIGKTSLIHRYISNEFEENYESTVGLDFQTKKVHVTPDEKIILKLWDTAGSEKYSSIAKNYFSNCDGIILCFDINDIKTFNNIYTWINYINDFVEIIEKKEEIKEFIEEKPKKEEEEEIIEEKAKKEVEEEEDDDEDKKVVIKWFGEEKVKPVIVLAGTKSDIGNNEINIEDIDKLKKYLNCEFFETSAKDGNGVDDLFFYIAKELFDKKSNKNKKKRSRSGFKLENKRINEDDEGKFEGICNSKVNCC